MKILAIGDPHFKLDWPYGELIKDGRKSERAAVLKAIRVAAEDCDAVVFMGDNLDKRHNHSSVIKEFVDYVSEFKGIDVYIISGNHETYEGSKTAIDFLRSLGMNWHIFTPSTEVPFFNKTTKLGFIPYMTNASLGASTKEEATKILMDKVNKNKYDVIFTHHAISGTETVGSMADLFDEIVLPRGELEAVSKLVVGGHIHQPQVVGRTIVTGNIFSHDVGDVERMVWKIDSEDGSYESIRLPIRPIYKLFDRTLENLDVFPKNAIVKAILTERGQDIEAVKQSLKRFDAHILVESYPNERTRMHVDESQQLDLSIDALLDLYAKAKKKDPERLHKAFKLLAQAAEASDT